jgi:hypothetical protein
LAKIFCFFVPAKGKQQFLLFANASGEIQWLCMRTKGNKLQVKRKPRTKKAEFMLSDEEYELIALYLKKYKISNRSRWFRETVMNHILKNMDKDYPTLFVENEMRR